MQPEIAHMLISTEELDLQSELDHANRAFAAMVGGQRYENITREEAERLCPELCPNLVFEHLKESGVSG